MRFTLSSTTAAEIERRIKENPQRTMIALNSAMREAVLYIEARIKSTSPAATGILRDSWHSTVNRVGDNLTGEVGTGLPYAEAVELGTAPHMPPIQPIKDWVAVKLGISGEEQDSAAWRIAMKIKRRGTKGQGTVQAVIDDSQTQNTYNAIVMRHLSGVGL
jgi:hypothetical protein